MESQFGVVSNILSLDTETGWVFLDSFFFLGQLISKSVVRIIGGRSIIHSALSYTK